MAFAILSVRRVMALSFMSESVSVGRPMDLDAVCVMLVSLFCWKCSTWKSSRWNSTTGRIHLFVKQQQQVRGNRQYSESMGYMEFLLRE